jgi:hypothetical protein
LPIGRQDTNPAQYSAGGDAQNAQSLEASNVDLRGEAIVVYYFVFSHDSVDHFLKSVTIYGFNVGLICPFT